MKQIKQALAEKRNDIQRIERIRRDKWKSRTAVERAITPGPGAYAIPSTLVKSGGAWSNHKPKTEIDWIEARAGDVPGPGTYKSPTTLNSSGGSWSKYKPMSDVDWAIKRAKDLPGPGEYGAPQRLKHGNGVKFGAYNPKTDIDLAMAHANDTPSPGHCQPSSRQLGRKKKDPRAVASHFRGQCYGN